MSRCSDVPARTPTRALVAVALALGACSTSTPARHHTRPASTSLSALTGACASVKREVRSTLDHAGGLHLAERKLPADVRRTLARVLTAVHARLVGECTASVVRALQHELHDLQHTRAVSGKGVPTYRENQPNTERSRND